MNGDDNYNLAGYRRRLTTGAFVLGALLATVAVSVLWIMIGLPARRTPAAAPGVQDNGQPGDNLDQG